MLELKVPAETGDATQGCDVDSPPQTNAEPAIEPTGPEQAGDATQDCGVDSPAQANAAPVIGPTSPEEAGDATQDGGVESPARANPEPVIEPASASDSDSAAPIDASRPRRFCQPRDHRRRAARAALLSTYPSGFSHGELADTRLGKVNNWLKANGKALISAATLRRAESELNQELEHNK
jgi:hypothetical protein